jgi:asparagine synthase (glutamine-hydrolysing)
VSSIAVLITDLPPDMASAQLGSMIGCMLHEPFYRHRTLCIPSLGCYVGWVSHDASFADCEVATSPDKDRVLVFAGENFLGRTPVASLVSMDRGHEERFLRQLNGWFAGVLVDLNRQTVLLFNDRFALHRLYYTRTKDSLLFSSEAKSLLAVRPESRQLDPIALGQVFAVGSVFDERSLFRDVSQMPGGSRWVVRSKDDVEQHRYFRQEDWEGQPPLTEEAFYESLRGTLERVIPEYLRHPQTVAVSLTAGLDTRAIMAFADHASPRRSYTYGGMFRDSLDVRLARRVAGACGYEHEVLRLGTGFLATLPELAERSVWITDGTLDVLGSHELYLSRLARPIAPIRLTGNFGSEIFRGANTFKPLRLSKALFTPDFLPYILQAERTFADASRVHPVSFAAFKDVPCNLYGRLAVAQSQLTVRSPYTDNEVVSLAYRAPRDARHEANRWHRLIAEKNSALASIPTDKAVAGRGPSLATLPARIYSYLLFKGEWYYDAGMPHWLTRIDRHAKRLTPPWFVGSHKIEHYRVWFRDHAREWLRSMLVDSLRGSHYIDERHVRAIVRAHLNGTGNFSYEINKAVTFELVHRLFAEWNSPKTRECLARSNDGGQATQQRVTWPASSSLEHIS